MHRNTLEYWTHYTRISLGSYATSEIWIKNERFMFMNPVAKLRAHIVQKIEQYWKNRYQPWLKKHNTNFWGYDKNDTAWLFECSEHGISHNIIDPTESKTGLEVCPFEDLALYADETLPKYLLPLYKERLDGKPPITRNDQAVQEYQHLESVSMKYHMYIHYCDAVLLEYVRKIAKNQNLGERYKTKFIHLDFQGDKYLYVLKDYTVEKVYGPDDIHHTYNVLGASYVENTLTPNNL